MFRDHEFPMSSGAFSILTSESAVLNDDFDDVFGSEPGSPVEGIFGAVSVSAAKSEDIKWTDERSRLEELFKNAKEELKTEKMFAREWWGEDGIWKFEVPGEKEGKDVVFPDVAAAHPLLKKWEGLVEEEIQRWSLDLEFMEGNEEEAVPAKQQIKADAVEQKMGTVKTDLNW